MNRRGTTARWGRAAALAGLIAGGNASAHADRDIVYSARYYSRPGSHRRSHFHLYRINADGSGRLQLTHGSGDDTLPRWSPDGTTIAFVRRLPGPMNPERTVGVLCVVPSRGGRVVPLKHLGYENDTFRWSQDRRALVHGTQAIPLPGRRRHRPPWERTPDALLSPDGNYLYLSSPAGTLDPDTIADLRTGARARTPVHIDVPAWVDRQTLVGVVGYCSPEPQLSIIGADGKERRRVRFRPLRPTPRSASEPPGTGVARLQPIPGDTQHVVWCADEGNSTIRPCYGFYRVDLRTGTGVPFGNGQFLTWSADARRYGTANRDLIRYGTWRDGRDRLVWGTPLWIVDARSRKAWNITPGLVWVEDADWRKPGGRSSRSTRTTSGRRGAHWHG